MVHPVHERFEVSRSVIAITLLRARGVEVQASVHVDDAGSKRGDRDVTGICEDVAPARERSRGNRIRCDRESSKTSTQQVASCDGNEQEQNGNRARKEPESGPTID